MHENEIGTAIVDSAIHLHQALGPGLLESVYEVTLARQLEKRGLSVQRQVSLPIEFDPISVPLWLCERKTGSNKVLDRAT